MTLGELIQYTEDVKSGKNPLPCTIYYYRLDYLHNPNRKTITINYAYTFSEFLILLYYVFKKIEMKLEKRGYSEIIYIPKEKSHTLDQAKDTYKSMVKSDYLTMYSVIKQLFYCYVEYIKDAFDKNADITEGDHLPGTKEELKQWVRDLNSWDPKSHIDNYPGFRHGI